MYPPSKNAPAAFLRVRHRLADSGLRLDPCAGCRFGLERTGERMLGAAQRHADGKTWHVVGAHPVLIQDECHEHLVSHCPFQAARAAFAPFARARLGMPRPAGRELAKKAPDVRPGLQVEELSLEEETTLDHPTVSENVRRVIRENPDIIVPFTPSTVSRDAGAFVASRT